MKKDRRLQKFLTIAFFVLSFIFVLLLMLFIFNTKITIEDMQNQVVKIIVISLTVLYGVTGIAMLVEAFWNREALSAVVLYSDRASSTRVTDSVIKKIVKENAARIEGVKAKGASLYLDENGGIRMAVSVTVKNNDVDFAVDRFRCLLFNAIYEVLGVEFSKIDFKVTALQPKFTPDMEKVEKDAQEMKVKREKLAEAKKLLEEEAQRAEEQRLAEENALREKELAEKRAREESHREAKLQELSENKQDTVPVEEAVPTAENASATTAASPEQAVVEVPADAVIEVSDGTAPATDATNLTTDATDGDDK